MKKELKDRIFLISFFIVILGILFFVFDRGVEFLHSKHFWLSFITTISTWFLLISAMMTKYYYSLGSKIRDDKINIYDENITTKIRDCEFSDDNINDIQKASDFKVYLLIHYTVFIIGVVTFGFDQISFMLSDINGTVIFHDIGQHKLVFWSSFMAIAFSLAVVWLSYNRVEQGLLTAYMEHDHSSFWGIPDTIFAYLRIFSLWSFIYVGLYSSYYKFTLLVPVVTP